jgi:DNA repair exonuclease SbcCD ATPase subunit
MSTIQNIKDAQNAYTDAMNSAGVSMEANNIYMETTEAHVGQLKASFQELSVDVFNSDFMKGFVDSARGAVEILDTLIEKLGVVGTVALGALGGMGIAKGVSALKVAFEGIGAAISGPWVAGILAAIAAISWAVKAYNDYNKQFTYEGKLEKASESAQKFKESTEELKSIDAEIESVRAKIEEINSIGGISINKEGELANLQSTLESLEIEKALLEEINELNRQQALSDASNFLGTESSYETGKIVTKTLGSGQEYGVRETKEGTPLDKALDYQERINKATEERTQLLNDINKSKNGEKKLDEATIKNYQQRADALKNELSFLTGEQKKTLEDIRTNYASLFDENGKVYDGYQKYVDDVNNFYKQIKDAGAKTTKSQLTSFVDDISKSFKNSKISGLSAEQFSKIFGFKNAKDAFGGNKLFDLSDSFDGSDEVTSAVESIVQKAKELGIISDTSSSSVRSLAESLVEAGVIGQESAEGLSEFAEAAEESTDAMEALNKYNDAYTSAMSASTSATGLNTQQIKDLTDAYSHLDGFNPSILFEKTANGIHLNEEYLKKLNAQIENEKMTELWQNLEKLEEQRAQMDAKHEDTSKIDAEIESARQLIAQYEGLTSAYNKWQSAKSATKERDMYQNVGSAYEQMKETLDQGWYGDEELNAYLDMMLSASQRTGDAYEDFQKLDRKIEGTSHSLMDYWQYDDDKNLVTDGMFDFLDDINKVFGDTYARVDENGKYTWDLTNGKLDEVAEHFGTTTEMIQLFERALIDAGATVILDSQEINDLQGNLQRLQQAGQISSEIDLGFEASEMSIEDIKSKIQELENEKVRIEAEADTDGADTALNQLEATINALKSQEIALKIQTELKNGKSIDDLLGDEDLAATLDIDTSQVEEARAMLEQLKSGVDVPITVQIQEEQFAALTDNSETVTVTYAVDAPPEPEYKDQEPNVKYNVDAPPEPEYKDQNPSVNYHLNAPPEPVYNNIDRTIKYTIVTVGSPPSGGSQATGTMSSIGIAHANGTAYNAPWNFMRAFSDGKISLDSDQIALVNELGTESIILICDFIQQCISNIYLIAGSSL